MTDLKRKFWGWGFDHIEVDPELLNRIKQLLKFSLGVKEFHELKPPAINDIKLREPRFDLPDTICSFSSSDAYDRLSHTYGKSFRDVWRGLNGQFTQPPDYVSFPKEESDIETLFEFASENKLALVPYGGGSSVVGGVETADNENYLGTISVNMCHFNRILEVDQLSRTARVQAGILGPELEQQLKEYELTLRHYPQSYEFSTLGGWIATRSGGHFATLHTRIDDFVQSIRLITPRGLLESRRFPASGAGPDPNRLVLGSEGILGIITEAWIRVQEVPQYKMTKSIQFEEFSEAVEAVREISQSGLYPSNARLIDPLEALGNGMGNGTDSILMLGFESIVQPVKTNMDSALGICMKHHGKWKDLRGLGDKASEDWKKSFLMAPYIRDEIIKLGLIVETFETATTWSHFHKLDEEINKAVMNQIQQGGEKGFITRRFTHIYPDGPAPYYTVICTSEKNNALELWDKIKQKASGAINEFGGTITHHHAVGRDHRAHFHREVPATYLQVLKEVKQLYDPQNIMNPGVLI